MILLVSLLLSAQAGVSLEEARRLFERGDYPAAEAALERVLASLPPGSEAERAGLLPRLAEVRALQGDFIHAAEAAEEALRAPPSPSQAARRAAAFVYVRSHRYEEALPHIEALLATAPDDPALRFWRGTVLSRRGRFAEAIEDLAAGLGVPGGARDARFEMALALSKLGRPREALDRLLEILEDDPWDAEACHQVSRQLLRIGGPGPSRAAANLVRWFEALREAEGASSRDRHLAFQGKPALAALERAARAERLGRYDRALEEIERAKGFEGGAAEAATFEQGFWARRGVPASAPARDIEEALGRAEASRDDRRAQEAARLLLARDPGSARALRSLAERARDPVLLPVRLHYLTRLAAAEPGNPVWKKDLEAARRMSRGDAPEK
jgi:tetratricopeptide (TPR) repeat protein